MKILLCNSPPRAGKDTLCLFLYNEYSRLIFEKFSAPLKLAFSAISGTVCDEYYENDTYESCKDDVIDWLGVSYRKFHINLGEKHLKPLYGEDIFGRLLVERLSNYPKDYTALVSDSGFKIEIDVLEKHYDPKDVLLLRIHRKGTDFSNDSREWVYTDKFKSLDVNNNGSIEDFQNKGRQIFEAFIEDKSLDQYNEEIEE